MPELEDNVTAEPTVSLEQSLTDALYAGQRIVPGDPKPPAKEPEKATAKEVEDAPVVEPEKKPAKTWDHDRQQRDIAHANEVKSLQKSIGEMQAKLAAQEVHASTKAQQSQVDERQKEVQTILDDLTAVDSDGDATASAADIAKAIKRIREIDASAPKAEVDLSPVLAQIEALKAQLAEVDNDRYSERSKMLLGEILDGLDKQYDPKYRSDAKTAAGQQLADEGFDENNIAPAGYVRLLLANKYRELFEADKKAPVKRKVKVPVDNGRGGTSIPADLAYGDLDSVVADMQRRNMFG